MVNADADVKQLLADLKDFNKDRRRKAVYRLGMHGGEEALKALMLAVEDDNEDLIVRSRAAQMLGRMRDARAVTPLIIALNASGYQTPINAAQALGRIGDKSAIAALVTLSHDHSNQGARDAALTALDKLGYDPEAEAEAERLTPEADF